jgi:oxygen-independent coproporphyrinogen III oxidase
VDDLLGIYLHIPFCASKCYYCNFASGVYPDTWIKPYLESLKREIRTLPAVLKRVGIEPSALFLTRVDSIYVGGGTPSFIPGHYIRELIELLREQFLMSEKVEITLEVNPGSVDEAKADAYLQNGINRVSIGTQTFQDDMLRRIGRSHNVNDSLTTLDLVRSAGIRNVSLDLIAGLPGQTLEDWDENLTMIRKLSPQHVSMYILEIHEQTAFGRIYGNSLNPMLSSSIDSTWPSLPDEDTLERIYLDSVSRFASLGYCQYEISNFARPGFESRHNLKYWTDQPFLGFGCSAFSYYQGKRWGNEKSVKGYIDRVGCQGEAVVSIVDVTSRQHEEEAIFLGLRLTRGIDLDSFRNRFGCDLQSRYRQQLDLLTGGNLLEIQDGCLRLTSRGWLLSNEIFAEFLQ